MSVASVTDWNRAIIAILRILNRHPFLSALTVAIYRKATIHPASARVLRPPKSSNAVFLRKKNGETGCCGEYFPSRRTLKLANCPIGSDYDL